MVRLVLGKSTLINLIPRFFDVTKGEILIDGIDIRQVSGDELHDQIGYIPQKGILLSGTIESNIKYGKSEATIEEVEQAARIAQAMEFISSKEEGYESPISQGRNECIRWAKTKIIYCTCIGKEAANLYF